MRFPTLLLVVAGVCAPWLMFAAAPTDPAAEVARMRPALVETRRWFHQHAELSNREIETSREIARRLTALGYPVQTGVAHTGVVATLQGAQPGPLLAWRADIDALPVEEKSALPYASLNKGVMHACGHDVHITVGLGAAEVLMKRRKDVRGTIRFIFQPAEEGAPPGEEGGAALMVKEGVLQPPPRAIFGLHVMPQVPVGSVAVRAGPVLAAADRFSIKVRGKKAHGAMPHLGVDAVYVGAQLVDALQSRVSRRQDARQPLVISVGQFHAGNRFNILADEATLEGTVRTLDPATHAVIKADLEGLVHGVCQAHGASCELTYANLAPVTVNDPTLTARGTAALTRALGADHVKEWTPAMVAEDFAFFAQQVPGLYFILGVGAPGVKDPAGIHTPDFQVDEDALVTGVNAAVSLLLSEGAAR
ncbi:MAG: M20 family metallopeptidase [Myxococcota bacterium]